MSLIALRNFSAPFSNKASLATMTLVVLMFTILRLTMGSTTGATSTGRYSDLRDSADEPSQTFDASALGTSSLGGLPQPSPESAKRAAPIVRGDRPSTASLAPSQKRSAEALSGQVPSSFFDVQADKVTQPPESVPHDRLVDSFSDGDLLGEILGTASGNLRNSGSEGTAAQPGSAAQDARAPGKLDAIEKRLGLR